MKKKIFEFSILFTIFISLSQSALVFIFNHYLIIDYSAYETPPQSFEMLNLADQKLYHLTQNLRFLHSILAFLLIISFFFVHLFFFYISRKEKFIPYSFFCFVLMVISTIANLLEGIEQKESIFWYYKAFLDVGVCLIYLLFLDKFFQSHLFKIFFVCACLCTILTEFKFMDFTTPFVLPIYLFILLILMRKKSFNV
ncbi:hypothetical protein NYK30_000234 [Campylobacter coli]|uniref:hypothetical protein n=1 Tax=Campylobacter coli TaxID=195 RepID=UPI00071748AB|nr:hypothetical protein [Campylobacter coli]EAH6996285.1 hypothetical protein [Campylobacter coli]EAH8133274.1 hypothetical protein [Campylobacter coli]EAH9873043.1 hypothetical protein [Campylobacter coli]EAH9874171.1 hypothetical protein [Campylobacter coli]EAI0185727.1 hypothetical protein [Campylobacter coli]